MNCKKCNAPLEDNVTFCPSCGEKNDGTENVAVNQSGTAPQNDNPPQGQGYTPPPYNNYSQGQGYVPPSVNGNAGQATDNSLVIALVLGGISIVFGIMSFWFWYLFEVALICGIVGLVFSLKAKKAGKSLWVLGLCMGIAGMLLGLITLIMGIWTMMVVTAWLSF